MRSLHSEAYQRFLLRLRGAREQAKLTQVEARVYLRKVGAIAMSVNRQRESCIQLVSVFGYQGCGRYLHRGTGQGAWATKHPGERNGTGHTDTEGTRGLGFVDREQAQQMVSETPLAGRFTQPQGISPVVVLTGSGRCGLVDRRAHKCLWRGPLRLVNSSVKGFQGRLHTPRLKPAARFCASLDDRAKDREIRSNLLTPGPVNTPQIVRLPREAINQVVTSVPLGRIAEVDQIASAAMFLASDESALVTGIELSVDDGATEV